MLTLKIGKFPGRLNEYVLEDGVSVNDALEIAEINADNESEVQFNGTHVNLTDVINEDGKLVVTKRIKGNF